jgi:16S rRNA (guanine966-N2)-methyltransferase
MRIIAGEHRGRRLAAPSNDLVRPTTDRVREALFSIIGQLDDTIVLDAFAGSGALGCEALSRGASFCYFFDAAKDIIAIVRDNVDRIKSKHLASIHHASCLTSLHLLRHDPDLIFLDPPYGTDLPQRAIDALASCPKITQGAFIVLEQEIEDAAPTLPDHFLLDDERIYSRTRLQFIRVSALSNA